jgi:hypothetical protein
MPSTLRSTPPETSARTSPPGEGCVPQGWLPRPGPVEVHGCREAGRAEPLPGPCLDRGHRELLGNELRRPVEHGLPFLQEVSVPLPARSPKRAGWSRKGSFPPSPSVSTPQREVNSENSSGRSPWSATSGQASPSSWIRRLVGLRFVEGHQLDIVQPRKPDRCALSGSRYGAAAM